LGVVGGLVLLAACGHALSLEDTPENPTTDDASAPLEAGAETGGATADASCDYLAPFTSIRKVISSPDSELSAHLSPDERVVYYDQIHGTLEAVVERASRGDPKSPFDPSTAVTLPEGGFGPFVTDDELTAYFMAAPSRDKTGIAVSTRLDAGDPFTSFAWVTSLSDGGDSVVYPFLSSTRDELFYEKLVQYATNFDLWSAPVEGGVVGTGTRIDNVNSTFNEVDPVLSFDGLWLYFQSERAVRGDAGAIWCTNRAHPGAGFATPKPVSELIDIAAEAGLESLYPSWLSPDGCRLYLSAKNPTDGSNIDIYLAERSPSP
jgi:hypothetical protein